MIKDFLQWTRENEQPVEKFNWIEENSYTLIVHDTGIVEYRPKKSTSKQFVLSCAIHGNETAPIEVVNKLLTDISSKKLQPIHHTLFIFGNPKAINLEKRFCDENLNRLFASSIEDRPVNYETLRAKKIRKIVDDFYNNDSEKFHYDLHTAIRDSKIEKFAMSPFQPEKKLNMEQAALLKKMGIEAIVLGNAPATTFSYHSASLYDAEAFTLELGKVRKFGKNDKSMQDNLETVLTDLLTGKYESSTDVSSILFFSVDHELIRNNEDFSFSFSEDQANFTAFNKDELISIDGGEQFLSPKDDSRILFPNSKVKLGQRACLIISAKDLPL
jgi:succinylglutamate desuccinylase